jgi:hypothetical protein
MSRPITAPPTAAGTTGGDRRFALARFGLVAKGVLYTTLGLLAVQFARGEQSSDDASPQGAIEQVADQPFGRWLLIVLTVGLVCLTVWHLIQAVTGDPVEGDGFTDRVKYAGKAVSYGVICAIAAGILISTWGDGTSSGGGSGDGEQQATAAVLDWPAGRWLVGAAGLVAIGIGLYALIRYAAQGTFMDRLDRSRMRGSVCSAVEAAGRVGYGARGVVFAIIGGLLITAAVRHRPDEAGGFSEALQALAEQPWGRVLLWVVAVGLVLYGLFTLAEARYRQAA